MMIGESWVSHDFPNLDDLVSFVISEQHFSYGYYSLTRAIWLLRTVCRPYNPATKSFLSGVYNLGQTG